MWRRVFCLAALAAIIGCSDGNPTRYEVRGQVLFPDGKPVTTGTIEFQSIDHDPPLNATGSISPEGRFELGTFDVDDGAVPGRHRAVVLGDGTAETRHERPELLPPQTVHPRHRQFGTSGLEFTVESDDNEIEVRVDYAPKTRR